MVQKHARYDVTIHMQAEILDDRFQDAITAEQKRLMDEASAYVEVVLTTQLLTQLSRHMTANVAQYAVGVFVEELKHVYIRLGAPYTSVRELQAPDVVVEADEVTPMLEVGPTSHALLPPKKV